MSLDLVIHQPARLRLMSLLVGTGESLEFTDLRDRLRLTDGNLGAHLRKLETAGYVRLEKSFVDRKPRTLVSATDAGSLAFVRHVEALQRIISGQVAV